MNRFYDMIANNDDSNNTEDKFWWRFNSNTRVYYCSESLFDLCGISGDYCSEDDFMNVLHPGHRANVINAMIKFKHNKIYDETFLLLTKYGYRWVNSKVDKYDVNSDGDIIIYGDIIFMDAEDVVMRRNKESTRHLDELIDRYSIISDSLMDLMYNKDVAFAVNKALSSLLEAFDGDRAYMFEYDKITKTQSCAYEVVNDSISPEKDKLQNIPLSDTKWWTQKLLNDESSIICDDIKSLASDARSEYDMLSAQNVKSVLVVPLMTRDGVGGYIGIDMVSRYYSWTHIDIQWFQSLANILSLCVDLKKTEEKAKAERERFVNLYENMPIGFLRMKLLYDTNDNAVDYTVMDINHMACSYFNVEAIDVLNSNGNEIANFGILESKLNFFDNVAKTKEVHSNVSIIFDDRYFDYTIYSVEQEEVIMLINDVTESTLASRALRKSEATLQNIYNNIPVGIEMYDKDGYLISINNREKEIFGFENEEDVLGVNLFDNPNVPLSFINDLKEGRPSWCDFVYDFKKLDGYYVSENYEEKHIALRGSALYDADHNVENYIFIVLDNTDYLKTSHKLHEFELLFNSIAEFSEIGMCRWDPNNNIIIGTDQWYDNLSIPKQEVTDISQVYVNGNPDDVAYIQKGFSDIISGAISSFRAEVRINSGNDTKWLRCNYKASDYRPQDNVIEIVSINIDITELKNTEFRLIEAKLRAEESDRLKSSFIANMSHEIRTPLNSIVGFCDLLLDQTISSQEREQYITIVKQNNDLLLQLISDILDISKIESGSIDIKIGSVDVGAVCKDIITSFTSNIDVTIPIILESNADNIFITTDKLRLTQVLKNLISNAIKFTKNGSVTVGYKLEKDNVIFFVKDTGIGISKENQNDVFVKFIKINSFVQGTGLGLPICKSIVEKLNGKIWLESELGLGTCFWISIPIDIIPD